ncbi:sphingomyelin phosphodiesterase 4-like isoform X2 [Littorina saxatilis]|uniref:sphingomyelin phosphodiesterase 4-like isoform X2 n=1 Tax=Littorina saxatilis TaxID=31220 RepID=UPI0038B5F6A2
MAAFGPSSLMYQIQGLQTKTVVQKCRETEDILKRTSTKELRLVFPALLQSIFGEEGEPGWGVDKLSRSQHAYDFEDLLKFLGPEGPLLQAVYSLQADPFTAYEFPFKNLPGPSRHLIEEGGVPVFYVNKLQTHGFSMPTVSLNAFEMYMFHFAYALVSPAWQQGGTGWSSRMYDTLYPTLVDEYLNYFLPLDRKELPAMPHVPSPVRSPVAQLPMSGRPVQRCAPYSPPRSQHPSLFQPSFTLAQKLHAHASPVFDSTEAETWRSETMLQVFVEFWLNQNSLVTDIPTFAHGAVSSMYFGQRAGAFNYLFEHFMPSLNQVMVVRMLVKYLHYFTNSAATVITSPYMYQQRVESPLDHFKRTVVPQTVQKKLYWFLRHAFDRWPMDCYFRMVLETWLSYVQPWRYTDVQQYYSGKKSRYHETETRERRVEDKWDRFIEDNLLFYTVLFQELLPRLHRMDFSSPQSAYMLYRLTKVYSSPHLAELVSNAEQEVCGLGMSLNHTAELGGSYLSASRMQPPAPTLPPHLSDMEVAGFQYQPLFCDRTRYVMAVVMQKAAQAHAVATAPRSVTSKAGGVFSWFWSLFEDDGNQGGVDSHRTPAHLEQAVKNIAFIFTLQVPEGISSQRTKDIVNESTMIEEDETLPDCVYTPEGPKLTDRGKYQIINNLRHFDNWQTGDPDLQPIRSFENATLVRVLYKVCAAVNSHFSSQIWGLYQRQDLMGRLAKVYLSPPLSPAQRIQTPVTPETAQRLRQPRLSLRMLASYQTIAVLVVLYLLLHAWLNTGPVSFSLLLVLGLLLYGMVCAMFMPVKC